MTKIAYAAGLLDGEGSIMMLRPGPRRARRPELSISMTERAPVQAVCDALGGFIRESPRPVGRKTIYCWRLQGVPALDALARLRPYIVIERRRALAGMLADADLVLRSRQSKVAHNEDLFERMRARNAQRLPSLPDLATQRPKESDYAYLAGILDGEGHVNARRIEVFSTDPELPAWLASRFGGAAYLGQSAHGNRRAIWRWARSPTGCQWAARVADLMLLPEKADKLRPMQDFKRTPPPPKPNPSAQPHPEDEEYLRLRKDWVRKEAIQQSGIPLQRARYLDRRGTIHSC